MNFNAYPTVLRRSVATLLGLVALCATISSNSAQAEVLARYPFTGNSSASTDTNTNSTAGAFLDGPGLVSNFTTVSGAGNPLPGIYISFGDVAATTITTAVNNGEYMGFSFTPRAGYEIDLTSLTFDHSMSTANNDMNIALRTSLDGFAVNVGSVTTSSSLSWATASKSLSTAAFQNVVAPIDFRLFFADPGNLSGDTNGVRIDNVVLNGTVTASQINGFTPAYYGIKSTSSGSLSTSPTILFGVDALGTQLDVAPLLLSGAEIDADGLAMSAAGELYGFRIQGSDSALITINKVTGASALVGSVLAGRDIRGATFSAAGDLWALDATANSLLRINPSTGGVIGSDLGLTLAGSPFDLSNSVDLAEDINGEFHMVVGNSIYSLNPFTGTLLLEKADGSQNNVGVAVSPLTPAALVTLQSSGGDDLYSYDMSSEFSRTTLMSNFYSPLEAGRGDLAAAPIASTPVPEPTMALVGIACIGTAALRRVRAGRANSRT